MTLSGLMSNLDVAAPQCLLGVEDGNWANVIGGRGEVEVLAIRSTGKGLGKRS